MHQLTRFLNLPAAEQRRVLQTAMLVIAFRLGLWIVPYRHLKRMVDGVPRRKANPTDQRLAEVVRSVVSFSRFIPEASCLTQALTTQVLLKREGFDPTLQIGVARDPAGVFKAHAWVELDGRIVVGDFSQTIQYVQMSPVTPAGVK